MRIGLQRVAYPSPTTADAGDPELVGRLRDEIAQHGPISVARFMERALYEPGLGYYATRADRATRSGDFLTAPELHPLFGAAVARQVDEMWQRLGSPPGFTVREYGAGTGALGAAIRSGLRDDGSPLAEIMSYEPIETAGRPAQPADVSGPVVGCVLANEFLDALPFHRLVKRDGQLREVNVDWSGGRFMEVEGGPASETLAAWFGGPGTVLAEGQYADVNPAMLEWLSQVTGRLERGYVLIFDYGLPAAELYGSEHPAGTLRAFAGQQVSSDVFAGAGTRDITATLDLDALERGARDTGLTFIGRTTQAEFLVGCGLEELLPRARQRTGKDLQGQLLLRSAVGRLLDPRQLGGYAAVVLGRAAPATPPLRGLAFRLRQSR